MPDVSLRLDDLLYPIARDDFFSASWEREPMAVSRQTPQHYSGLFSLADLETVIAFTRPKFTDVTAFAAKPAGRSTYVRGVLSDQPPAPTKNPGIPELRQAFDQGKSVVIMAMQHRWPAIARLCRNLEAEFRCPVHANLYLTPPGSQGFASHFDPHEVFVLQLEGTKQWRLYERNEQLPLADTVGTPRWPLGHSREFRLEQGDLLYIPRGHVHDAYTRDDFSLHLTVGINVYRWADLLHHALAIVSRRHLRMRESVPGGALPAPDSVGELRDRFAELMAALAEDGSVDDLFDCALRSLGDQFFHELQALPRDGAADRIDSERLDADTILERPSQCVCRVLEDEAGATIEFPGNRVSGPHRIAPSLRFIAGASRFAIRDLPGELNTDAKVVLARRLVGEGLLRPIVPLERTAAGKVNAARAASNGENPAPARELHQSKPIAR